MNETEKKTEVLKSNYGNREVVSDVFSMLMEYQEYALDVYNALNGSCYEDPSLVRIEKLKQGISLSIRNDASFIVGGDLQFYEHQSTHNPNMPLRHVIYYSDYLKQWIKDNDLDLYGRKRIVIPSPHFVVFYNGTDPRPDIEEMRLSDSFHPEGNEGDAEIRCTVYNVNRGRNPWLAEKCKVLREYGIFVDKIRIYRKNGKELEEAIDDAISDCIEEGVLKTFFEERRNEVKKSMQLDFTWERREQLIRKEEFNDGKVVGKAEAILELLEDLGEIPNELREAINSENNEMDLNKILRMAAKANNLEEFNEKFQELKVIG